MTVMTMNREALTYYAMSGPFTDLSPTARACGTSRGRCRSSATWCRD